MNKQTIEKFLSDPYVKEAIKDGPEEVARMAIMAGNLEKNSDLREFGEKLMSHVYK